MELKPFYHEAQVALADDFTLHLVVDLKAIDHLERLLENDIGTIAKGMLTSVTTMVKVLWALTREYHSDLDLNHIAGILLPGRGKEDSANPVALTIGNLMMEAGILSVAEPEEASRRRKLKAVG